MKLSRTAIVIVALAVAIATSGAAWAIVKVSTRPSKPEYADAPFKMVGADYPRILTVKEWPAHKDRATQVQYQNERAQVAKYLRDEGAISRVKPDERTAYLEVLKMEPEGFIKARAMAGAVLDADPQSVVGHLVMAKVEHYGEANLPRALYEIRQARRLLEIRGQANPDDAEARELYIFVLHEEYEILRGMDRREEQLRVVDLLEQVYQPMPWLRVFPLIKAHRLAEVEALVAAIDKDDHWPANVANWRLMLAEQRGDRRGVYEDGKAAVKKSANSAVLWSNLGGSCLNDFRHDEAEAAYKRANQLRNNFNNSAYFPLSALTLQKGRMSDAWQAVQQGHAQRARRNADTLQQDQSVAERSVALILLALGKGEEAERFARRAYERPGRLGSTTTSDQDEIFNNGFLFWLALQTRIQQIQENRASFDVTAELQLVNLQSESWALKQKLVKLLSDEDFLTGVLRPYLPGVANVEGWQLGSVLQLLPAGVAEEALARAREKETHPAAVAYFDAMAAELALAQGRSEEALTLVRKTLESLPPENEKLLRARIAAVGAEAARRLGRPDDARPLMLQALRDFPQVFRMLGFRIPVRIEDDGTPLSRQVATQLLRSPTFRQDANGFRVAVRQTGETRTMSLARGDQEVHVQFDIDVTGDLVKDIAAASARFHDRVMSPVLDLTPVQINSFDRQSQARS